MPVRYSVESSGPSTRTASDVSWTFSVPDPAPDLSGMTKKELQAEADRQGVSTAGNKADLIKRLSE